MKAGAKLTNIIKDWSQGMREVNLKNRRHLDIMSTSQDIMRKSMTNRFRSSRLRMYKNHKALVKKFKDLKTQLQEVKNVPTKMKEPEAELRKKSYRTQFYCERFVDYKHFKHYKVD